MRRVRLVGLAAAVVVALTFLCDVAAKDTTTSTDVDEDPAHDCDEFVFSNVFKLKGTGRVNWNHRTIIENTSSVEDCQAACTSTFNCAAFVRICVPTAKRLAER